MVIATSSPMQRYGIAVLAVGLAMLLMLLLNPWVAMSQSPFLIFFAAIMVSAWYGGMKPGLIATFLSALLSNYWFIYPKYVLTLTFSDTVRLSLFVLEGILVSVLCEALHHTNRQLEVSVRKLRSSEERYRRLIDTAYEGIWTLDAGGRINYVNPRMAHMLGYSVQEMLERPVFNFMDEEAKQEAKQKLERRQQGINEQYDFRFCCKDGSALWTIVSTTPILGDRGEFQGELAMITDVSDRISAQEAVRTRENELRLITNAVPVLISYLDAKQRYRFNNKRYEEWFGHPVTEVYGKHLREVVGEAAYETIRPYVEAVLSGQEVTFESEIFYKNSGVRYICATYVPRYDELGNVAGFVALVSDISDRKRLEDELRQSEARFRRLVESNIIGVFFPDLEGNIFEANDAFLNMVGYTREDLLAGDVNWKDITTPGYESLDAQKVEELITTGVCTPFEKEYLRKDGRRLPILVGAALLQESSQNTIAFALDLSDRNQALAALQESEAKFRRLVESGVIGVIFTDLVTSQITDANDAFLEMVGYNREDLRQGKLRWRDMTPPEYSHLDDRAIEEQMRTGVCTPFEKEYIRKDGSRVPILLGGALLQGSRQHTVCYVLDLSDRKRAIAALRESEERFRLMADTAPVLIWMSGTDKLCNYFNQPWLEFTGRTLEQEMGNGWTQGVHPDDLQLYLDTYTHACDARQEFRMEYRLRRFDGEYRWVLDTGIPRFTPDGNFLGYIGSCIDISDRKLVETQICELNDSLEKRVKERTAQLEAANQELESFSYSVSHDLRAPLRHIQGFIDLLEKRAAANLDETSLRYLNIIVESAKEAGKLVDDLLSFSRMARTQMHYVTIDMNQLVTEVQCDIEQDTKERTIVWQVEELPQVQGDPSMLRLVLSNLMGNAVKYTAKRDRAEIQIGSTQNESEFVFFIRDNGVGFDMRYVHKLFGVFQRLHSTEEFEGTGIGLANVQRIIRRHGGRTWAEGAINEGAIFYFSLPKLVKQ